jgi:flagellar basal body rod protein FlgG
MFSIINTGLTSSQRDLSVTANNLANSNTVGFKKSKSNFVDIFANDPTSNPKTAVGSGTMTATVDKDMSQGSMTSTGRVTDLAIAGKGFFTLADKSISPTNATIPTFSGAGLSAASWPAIPQPPSYPTLGPILGTDLAESEHQNTKTVKSFDGSTLTNISNIPSTNPAEVRLKLNNIDDSYAVYIDGNNIASFTNVIGGPAQNRDLDLTPYFVPGQSEIKLEFSNVHGPWAWDYELLFDGEVAKSGSNSYFGWDANEQGLIETVIFEAPDEPETVTGNIGNTYNWSNSSFNGTAENVFYYDAPAAGSQFNDSPYILFGGNGAKGSRSLTFSQSDLTDAKIVSFDLIKGNDFNGGELSENGEALSFLYSTDGGLTFSEIESFSSANFDNFRNILITLPLEARTTATILKFHQSGSSGPAYDHWGIKNFEMTFEPDEPVSSNTTNSELYSWSENGLQGKAQNVGYSKTNGTGSSDNGGFSATTPSIVFGNIGESGPRRFIIEDLDLRYNASINFDIIVGNDNNGGEMPENALENLSVYFSIDGGTTYNLLQTFEHNDYLTNGWTNISKTLPVGAKTESVTLKFEQPETSGKAYDHWAISNINFLNAPPPPVVEPETVSTQNGTLYSWPLGDKTGSAQNVFVSNQGLGIGNNIPFNGRQTYVTFGGGGVAGQRILTYPPLDLRSCSAIQFDLIAGNNTNGGDTSNVGELFYLEYSVDDGKSFKQLSQFDNFNDSLSTWTTKNVALPSDAKIENVTFRFRQPGSSGPQYDHWGLANVKFIDSSNGDTAGGKRVYTRAGNFQIDRDGYLTSSNGLRVLGTNLSSNKDFEAVRIDSSYNGNTLAGIDINSAGRITATYGDGTVRLLYDLAIASFDNDSALKQIGNTQFAATGESGVARYLKPGSGVGTVMAAKLEQSNTDITGELMHMLRTQQGYNANARMLQAYVEVASRLTDKI